MKICERDIQEILRIPILSIDLMKCLFLNCCFAQQNYLCKVISCNININDVTFPVGRWDNMM